MPGRNENAAIKSSEFHKCTLNFLKKAALIAENLPTGPLLPALIESADRPKS